MTHCTSRIPRYEIVWAQIALLYLFWGILLMAGAGRYKTGFYIAFLTPALIFFCLRPGVWLERLQWRHNLPLAALLLFLFYASLSALWSDSDKGFLDHLKYGYYVLVLYMTFSALLMNERRTFQTFTVAVVGSLLFLLSQAAWQFYSGQWFEGMRFRGGLGAIQNDLWASHLFGSYTIILLAYVVLTPMNAVRWKPLLIILTGSMTLLLLNGSRTPFAGIFAAVFLVSLLLWNRKSMFIISAAAMLAALLIWCFSDTLLERGLSHRPEIWSKVIALSKGHYLWGMGIDHSIEITLANGDQYIDAHSIPVAIFYYLGAVGLTLWAGLIATVLMTARRYRYDRMVVAAAGWVMFGQVAGLFEGASVLSRPKEHWFIIWVPLAFFLAAYARARRLAAAPPPPAAPAPGNG